MNKLKSFVCVVLPCFVLLTSLLGLTFEGTVFADEPTDNDTSNLVTEVKTYEKGSSFTGSCRSFLGFTSWDCGVDIKDEDSFKRDIGKIAVNVLSDINILAAYLVLGYVIYSGYLYMFSAGDSNKVAQAKKSLVHAFTGLAIVSSAFLIMSTIRVALIGDSAMTNCVENSCVDPNEMITSALQWVIGIVGFVSVIFVVYGGVIYVSSAGEPNKLQKAKTTITYALIGLAIVALAEVIVAFVSSMIKHSMV